MFDWQMAFETNILLYNYVILALITTEIKCELLNTSFKFIILQLCLN